MFAIPNPYSGLFIAFEGIDGCGKSTQIALVEKFLTEKVKPKINGCQIIRTKEPNRNAPVGYRIYQELARPNGLHQSNPHLFQSWYAVDSKRTMADSVIPNLQLRNIVLTDRFRTSMVYGITGITPPQQELADLMQMHWAIMGEHFIWPDLVFIFDLPVATALDRLSKHGKQLDEHERAIVLERVRANYLRCWPHCQVIDATGSPEQVFQACLPALNEVVFQKFQFYPS